VHGTASNIWPNKGDQMITLGRKVALLALACVISSSALAQPAWPFVPLTAEEEQALATTTPPDPVSWDYAYGEDTKGYIRLAWYRDLPGYIKYEKKWIRWVRKNGSQTEPTFSVACQNGLLFLGFVAAKDYEHASATLAEDGMQICNNFFSQRGTIFPESSFSGTQYGNWLEASRNGLLPGIVENAQSDPSRGELASRSALMALVQLASYNVDWHRRLSEMKANRRRESGEPSWSQILVGGAAQVAQAAASSRAQGQSYSSYPQANAGSFPAAAAIPTPVPSLSAGPAATAPTVSVANRSFHDASNCVYIDRSNSLGDFIGNHCSYPIMVWYCVTDPGHGFQCGGSPSVPALTIVGANDKSSTLKGRTYHWFACGSPEVDVHLFKSSSRWDGQHVRGRCSVD